MNRILTMNTLVRVAIVVLAALQFYSFSGGYRVVFAALLHGGVGWLDVVSALAPLCLVAATVLAIANTRLVLAIVLLIATPVLFCAPLIPFVIGVMIYGA